MKITSTNVFVGPNVYANFPVIRHQIDLGVLEDWPSMPNSARAFIDGLLEAVPSLHSHGCSYGEEGGFCDAVYEKMKVPGWAISGNM